MMVTDELRKRITRLVGDGTDEMSGGGLPLPDAFAAVLQHLMDSGDGTGAGVLVREVMKALAFKETRILAIWGSWESFAEDILIQLVVRKLVTVTTSKFGEGELTYSLSENFVQGKSYEVITAAEISVTGQSGDPICVTAYDAEIMKDRDEIARLVLALNGWERKVRKAGKLTAAIERLVAGVAGELESHGTGSTLPDQPDQKKWCPACEKWKPQTKAYFTVYLSRGELYWRVNCRACGQAHGSKYYQAQLARVVEELTVGGVVPRSQDVWAKMREGEFKTTSLKAIQASWDRIAKRGDLPPRN